MWILKHGINLISCSLLIQILVLNMFYRLILRLIHHILAICLLLKQWLTYLPLYAFAYQQKPTISSIKTDARTLKKIPNHLSIVVVENEISFTDVANIIIWSVALGISYISVFDFDGKLHKCKHYVVCDCDGEAHVTDTCFYQ